MSSQVRQGELAVVIPTRDRWPILARTLDALAAQTVSGFEVVVVIDGLDQHPPSLPGVTVVEKEHGGPGAARNAGVAATDAEIVLFLGDDMLPTPPLVERHLARHRTFGDDVDAVIGHVRWHPDVRGGRLLRWLDWSGTQFDFATIPGDDAGWPRFYSCNVSLKRSLFERAGGFDPAFTYYYEDLDMGWRLHEHGLRLWYERAAEAHHLHSYSWPQLVRRFEGIAVGERMMADKHEWFEPFFAGRIARARREPRRSAIWTWLVDLVPPRPRRVRAAVERRADTWYHQQLADPFLAVWEEHGAEP